MRKANPILPVLLALFLLAAPARGEVLLKVGGTGGALGTMRLLADAYEQEHPEVDNQRFFGFKRLTFANNFMDTSYLREKVAGDVFREGGVPAHGFHHAHHRLGLPA